MSRSGPTTHKVVLRAGTLHLTVARAEMELHELCGFASRRSRKRGFVFVSKVLGKHYPVRPRVMAAGHARLAGRLPELEGPVLFIALAETATALGHGVYESWLRQTGRDDALFLHSTRYRLKRRLALSFDEGHSHATEHLVYEPADPGHLDLFRTARTLVVVDDEISTGRTLENLVTAYRQQNVRLAAVHLVALTDWSGGVADPFSRRVGVPTAVHHLLQGSFAFDPDPGFDPGPLPDATGPGDFKDVYLHTNHGRLGLRGPLRLEHEPLLQQAWQTGSVRVQEVSCSRSGSVPAGAVRPGERVLVLGTGEFSYPVFLLAQYLEEAGYDVHYQSTTRSPLLVDTDIRSVVEFVDNYHDGIANYVYNVADRRYDRILIGYETHPLPAGHALGQQLGATTIFF